METFSTIKLYNFSIYTTFILVLSLFDKAIVTLFTKSTCLSYSFMKLEEERYIRFMNTITTTMLNEQMIKIKVVDL